jgi:hypothetical protein
LPSARPTGGGKQCRKKKKPRQAKFEEAPRGIVGPATVGTALALPRSSIRGARIDPFPSSATRATDPHAIMGNKRQEMLGCWGSLHPAAGDIRHTTSHPSKGTRSRWGRMRQRSLPMHCYKCASGCGRPGPRVGHLLPVQAQRVVVQALLQGDVSCKPRLRRLHRLPRCVGQGLGQEILQRRGTVWEYRRGACVWGTCSNKRRGGGRRRQRRDGCAGAAASPHPESVATGCCMRNVANLCRKLHGRGDGGVRAR